MRAGCGRDAGRGGGEQQEAALVKELRGESWAREHAVMNVVWRRRPQRVRTTAVCSTSLTRRRYVEAANTTTMNPRQQMSRRLSAIAALTPTATPVVVASASAAAADFSSSTSPGSREGPSVGTLFGDHVAAGAFDADGGPAVVGAAVGAAVGALDAGQNGTGGVQTCAFRQGGLSEQSHLGFGERVHSCVGVMEQRAGSAPVMRLLSNRMSVTAVN